MMRVSQTHEAAYKMSAAQVIVGNAISNGTFMLVPNRWGNEGTLSFYGSSFICDPYGRILARAPRHGDALLIAGLCCIYFDGA